MGLLFLTPRQQPVFIGGRSQAECEFSNPELQDSWCSGLPKFPPPGEEKTNSFLVLSTTTPSDTYPFVEWILVSLFWIGMLRLMLLGSRSCYNGCMCFDAFYILSSCVIMSLQVAVCCICFFVILPLNLVGTILGRNLSGQPNFPCRVNAVPRPIPEKKW